MFRSTTLAVLAALLLAIPFALSAQPGNDVQSRDADRPDLQAFMNATSAKDVVQQSEVYRDVAKNGKLGRLPARYPRALSNASKTISTLLKGHDSVGELDPAAHKRLDQARWDIVNVMALFDPDRIVCSEIVVTGSRFPQTQCRRVRDAILQEQTAQRATRDMQNGAFCQKGTPGCGGS